MTDDNDCSDEYERECFANDPSPRNNSSYEIQSGIFDSTYYSNNNLAQTEDDDRSYVLLKLVTALREHCERECLPIFNRLNTVSIFVNRLM